MKNKTTKQNAVGGRLLKWKEWGVISLKVCTTVPDYSDTILPKNS